MQAWRTAAGGISLGKLPPSGFQNSLNLPCGKCLGCILKTAQSWAYRCWLESLEHRSATFTTLTYADAPPSLSRHDLSAGIKRIRAALTHAQKKQTTRPFSYFACGEYGTQRKRAHYHAIFFGLNAEQHADLIDKHWRLGHTRTTVLTPERISYTVGYTYEKLTFADSISERVDPDTGEVYTHVPPFHQMSRRPGIGATARDTHPNSWRHYALNNGTRIAVPRYLHEGWKKTASEEAILSTAAERQAKALRRTAEQLDAAASLAATRAEHRASKRHNY